MKKKKKEVVEICGNCGKVSEEKDFGDDSGNFHCSRCDSRVAVVMNKKIYLKIAKAYGKKR